MAIIKIEDLTKIRKKFKDKKIVYCSGTFDLPHLAHMLHLDNCKRFGDILVVNVGPDKDIRRNKGQDRPILNEKIRIQTIDFIKPVDYCFIGRSFKIKEHPLATLTEVLEKLRPDIYVINKDSSHIIPYIKEQTKKYNIKLIILDRNKAPSFKDISTSKIIEKIKKLND